MSLITVEHLEWVGRLIFKALRKDFEAIIFKAWCCWKTHAFRMIKIGVGKVKLSYKNSTCWARPLVVVEVNYPCSFGHLRCWKKATAHHFCFQSDIWSMVKGRGWSKWQRFQQCEQLPESKAYFCITFYVFTFIRVIVLSCQSEVLTKPVFHTNIRHSGHFVTLGRSAIKGHTI